MTGDVGRRQDEDGVRDRRERVHRFGAHQDAAGEGLRREDDGQEPRSDLMIHLFISLIFGGSQTSKIFGVVMKIGRN